MRRALLLLLAASCGRFGFGDHASTGDAGDGGGSGDGSDGGNIAPFQPTWTNGTRFRARTLVVGDGGDPIFYGWRDTLLDTDCQNAIATDGMEHCMPAHARADQYYADAACTVRLGWVHGLCGHDAYAFYVTSSQYHEVPLTTPYTGPVYGGGTCGAVSAPSTGQLWSTGAEVPATTFALAHYKTVAVGAYAHVFGGWGDGSELDLNGLSFNQGSCTPTGGMASGMSVCKPTGDTVMTAVYSDAGCTQRAFYTTDSAPTNEFMVNATTMCGVQFTVYDTTGTVGGGTYYTKDATSCTMHSVGTGTLVTGAAVDPYPHGTIYVGPRRGRIGYLYWDAGDGVAMPLAEWDHDLGRSCRPFIAQDRVERCLPRTPKEITANPDGVCSATATTVAGNCYGLDPVDGVAYGTCDDGPTTIHTLASIAATSYYDEATCTSLGAAYDVSVTTGELPPTMFAALTEVIE